MGKKLFISFIVLAFINLAGCYSVSEVSKEEFMATHNRDAYLFTQNLEKYHFKAGNYVIQNDTLKGVGEKEIPRIGEVPFKGFLPLNTVNSFQTEYLDGLKTTGMIVGTIAIAGLLLAVIFASAFDKAVN